MIGCKFSTPLHPFSNVIKELGLSVFERFTERARQVVVLAQEEARLNKVRYIGPEHILVGLLREEGGLAAVVLTSLGVEEKKLREVVHGYSDGEVVADEEMAQIPMTPRTRKTLELALREALSLGHNYIGTEHILLGLLRESVGWPDDYNKAVGILADNFQLEPEQIRNEVIRMLSGPVKKQVPARDVQPKVERALEKLEKLKGTEELLNVLTLAVTLGRQFPDHPAERVARAARDLHG